MVCGHGSTLPGVVSAEGGGSCATITVLVGCDSGACEQTCVFIVHMCCHCEMVVVGKIQNVRRTLKLSVDFEHVLTDCLGSRHFW
jgi:hypothetical protein